MREAGGGDHVGVRFQCLAVESRRPLCLNLGDQPALAPGILGRHSRRAGAQMAALRLDAADRKHEGARRVAPVRPHGEIARQPHAGIDLAAGHKPDPVLQPAADQRVAHQDQTLLQGQTDPVGQLQRGGPGATLAAVHHDEFRSDAGQADSFHDGENLVGLAHAQLDSHGLAPRQVAHPGREFQHFHRRGKRRMSARRQAIPMRFNLPDLRDFVSHLGGGQKAAMTRFCPLTQLDFGHLDGIVLRLVGE